MRKALLTLALLLPAAAFAQETVDEGTSFGARATVEADAKLAKGFHLNAHEEVRWYSGDEDILRFYTGIGLEYKVLPFLKVGGEYEYISGASGTAGISSSREPGRRPTGNSASRRRSG